MSTENATLSEQALLDEELSEGFDLDELEAKLQGQLEEELADLEFLQEDKEKISSPDALGETIKNVVWEQFINQVASKAGADFIRENNGLHLDLSKDAHFVTPENFEQGKMPTHNPNQGTYQQRYNEYRSDLQTDPNLEVKLSKNMRYNEDTKTYERFDAQSGTWVGKTRYNEKTKVWEDWDTRAGGWKKKLAPGARDKFDTRTADQQGTAATAKDHTISAAEQIRDAEAAAYVDRETRKEFAKSDANLNDLDASANASKGDSTMDEWLNSTKDGKKPSERFDIDEEALREKDAEAREEYQKMKDEGRKKAIEEGKQSRREEALRIGGKAARVVVMQLLGELVKEIISKLVKWLKSDDKKLETLLAALKEAISSFVSKLKTHLINAADTAATVIATAIFGPVVTTIKKVWAMLKQGWQSLKEAVAYIRNPENKGQPVGILMMEVGKIVIAGLSAAGAIVLSEVIEKALIAIPGAGAVFAFEIPLIGSLANILGIFLGAVVAGIVGAIAINLLQKQINDAKQSEIVAAQIDQGNEALRLQHEIQAINEARLDHVKASTENAITERHSEAAEMMLTATRNIKANSANNESATEMQREVSSGFDDLLGELS